MAGILGSRRYSASSIATSQRKHANLVVGRDITGVYFCKTFINRQPESKFLDEMELKGKMFLWGYQVCVRFHVRALPMLYARIHGSRKQEVGTLVDRVGGIMTQRKMVRNWGQWCPEPAGGCCLVSALVVVSVVGKDYPQVSSPCQPMSRCIMVCCELTVCWDILLGRLRIKILENRWSSFGGGGGG